jgi:hypothetical protein
MHAVVDVFQHFLGIAAGLDPPIDDHGQRRNQNTTTDHFRNCQEQLAAWCRKIPAQKPPPFAIWACKRGVLWQK